MPQMSQGSSATLKACTERCGGFMILSSKYYYDHVMECCLHTDMTAYHVTHVKHGICFVWFGIAPHNKLSLIN